jgi:uncharacterized protein YjaZ
MFERPETVRVGPVNYSVVWQDNHWSKLTDQAGRCIPRENRIEINGELPTDQVACTFTHEVFHALEWHYKRWDDVDSEVGACLCGEGMVMFWRDNPEVFKWWQSLIIELKG